LGFCLLWDALTHGSDSREEDEPQLNLMIRQWRIEWTCVEFIETPTFTRAITSLLVDDDYAHMQIALVQNPSLGDVIRGGGGIRKLRYAVSGRGKRGGVRVIYYWLKDEHQIYMLLAYAKSVKDTLSAQELAVLNQLVKEL
jgi:hypothetical protein